ncbi:MAG: TraR/DksA family transcriptional regulator [Gammaproteobacteria bacterium]|nr:MAG: TraR/DksA family transcriptional regulator [Gammaproteobacteria bacterium]
MSSELNGIKQQLESRKGELLHRLDTIKQDVTKAHSSDWSEQAQERENDEVMNALGNEARLELTKVSQALERIENGSYTTCIHCGEDITLERLKAVPYTDLCIRCAGYY